MNRSISFDIIIHGNIFKVITSTLVFTIAFEIHCNFSIVLPIQLKICWFVFSVNQGKCERSKNWTRLRSFARPSALDLHHFPGLIYTKLLALGK